MLPGRELNPSMTTHAFGLVAYSMTQTPNARTTNAEGLFDPLDPPDVEDRWDSNGDTVQSSPVISLALNVDPTYTPLWDVLRCPLRQRVSA